MARSGSEKRQRKTTLSARFNDAEAALVKERAARAGVPVAALIRHAVLAEKPLRKSRTPPLDRKIAAQLLGQLGVLATALREASVGNDRTDDAIIDAAHQDLSEMRAVLFEALGRRP
ncbi:hypothetical protein DEA8626_01430 [Defluviimonas aquaemixtae]|uniref:Uncharacterized protein n=1 Tax=Albidovulum aquaemixtae TaxID=1542388 RepID=A0A2R8B5Q9_9RHOB|nr:hypothetical protein [Defluviimonas aquaemixtae]SPH17902.1 hypothetical protein DEA8626_01430 [Defluviimonas aquaemixtae]